MNSKTFCAATWMHVNTTPGGKLEPCCVWKADAKDPQYGFTDFDKWINSDLMKQVRKDLHSGIARPECLNCYVLEKSGSSSLRSRYNQQFANYKDFDQFDIETWNTKKEDIVTVQLKLGNLCDLKCVMCCGENSSQLQSEYKTHKDKFDNLIIMMTNTGYGVDYTWPLSLEFEQFLVKFKDNLRSIEMTGGEPTMIPYVVDFLESISSPEQVVLAFVTNANRYNPKFLDIISRFKHVNMTISLEGIGEHNDMIRFNSIWQNINDNILRYKSMPNVHVIINHVLQAFSVATTIPLIQWCESNNIIMSITVLTDPWHLRLDSVPTEHILEFKNNLLALRENVSLNRGIVDNIIAVLGNHKYNADSRLRRKEYITLLDDLRKTNLSSIID